MLTDSTQASDGRRCFSGAAHESLLVSEPVSEKAIVWSELVHSPAMLTLERASGSQRLPQAFNENNAPSSARLSERGVHIMVVEAEIVLANVFSVWQVHCDWVARWIALCGHCERTSFR